MSIRSSVIEIEDRVVDKVRTLQQPVVEYVRKGKEQAEAQLSKLNYPENLPKPAEVVESGVTFAKGLLDSQREFVTGLVDRVTPLVRPDSQSTSAKATAEATEDEAAPERKTKAAPAKPKARSSAKRSTKS